MTISTEFEPFRAERAAPAAVARAPGDRRSRTRDERRFARVDGRTASDLYLAVEAVLILVAGAVLARVYVDGALGVADYAWHYAAPLVLFTGLAVAFLRGRDLYAFHRLLDFSGSAGDAMGALAKALAGLVLAGFVANVANDYSRVWVVGWFAASVVLVLLGRALAARTLRRAIERGAVFQATAIYGPRAHAVATARRLHEAGTGTSVVGLFGPSGANGDGDGLARLVDFARGRRVDSIIVVGDPASLADLEDIVADLAALPVSVRLSLVSNRDGTPLLGVTGTDGVRSLDVQLPPIPRWGRFAKLVFDRVAAAVMLAALAPWLALVALAIRMDGPGPVFFRQRRHGFNQGEFFVWKFRTMRVMEDGASAVQATRGDARVTRVGAFLRSTSIDELPQLINVLTGDMSLVGPRPHPLSLDAEYAPVIERYARRLKVKPGITGLAQINGFRGPTDPEAMRRRLEYDLRYIENWSLWLDIKILLATPFLGIVGRNAF